LKKRKNRLQAIFFLALVTTGTLYYFIDLNSHDDAGGVDSSNYKGVADSQKKVSAFSYDKQVVKMNARSRARSKTTPLAPIENEEVVFTAPWGTGPGQVGRQAPEEGAPEGPMSFVIDDKGRYLVLDQVNSRIQVFEPGRPAQSISLFGNTFQDLILDGNGNRLVLDRLGSASITRLDPDGKYLGEIDLIGPHIPEGGVITGMFAKEDGIWIEVEHRRMVRVADADGNPDPDRPTVAGRFTADGRWLLTAALERPRGAAVFKQSTD
jgi:hypothetical protein